ncbi:MAG: hypothetical protein K0Q73_6311 [Paenibacillus sp.]|jgi:hypothetical protein|nr:hypothetical protein [Paenibacillus sp.]
MIIRRELDLYEIITQLGIDLESFEKWKASENLLPYLNLKSKPHFSRK